MIIMGTTAAKVVVRAILAGIAGKILADSLEWAVDNIKILNGAKSTVHKIFK